MEHSKDKNLQWNNFVFEVLLTYNNKLTHKQDIGLIAHELQEFYPFLVEGEKDGTNNQSINYIGLIGILINEIKGLKKEIKLIKEDLKK